MMIGQEDTSSNLGDEVLESTEESVEESTEESVEESTEESVEESMEESIDETQEETQALTLSLDDVPLSQSLDSLGLIGITCVIVIYLLGILVIVKRRD